MITFGVYALCIKFEYNLFSSRLHEEWEGTDTTAYRVLTSCTQCIEKTMKESHSYH